LSSKVSLAPAAMHRSSALNSATPALTSAKLHIVKFNRKLAKRNGNIYIREGQMVQKKFQLDSLRRRRTHQNLLAARTNRHRQRIELTANHAKHATTFYHTATKIFLHEFHKLARIPMR